MSYLALIESDGRAHGGLIPELGVAAVGKSTEQVRERLRQGLALALHERQRASLPLPEAQFRERGDLPAEVLAEFPDAPTELLEPAPINPVSVEIERAIEASGLSESEVARRMGTSPAAVARLQDYFYWGHSLTALRKLAGVLGVRVEVRLSAA
jgi:antitoxin HicB